MNWGSIQTFGDVIRQASACYAEKIAFKDRHRQLSFSEYEAEVNRLADALKNKGVQPGARLAVYSQGRIEVAVILGLCSAGFIPVPLNWRMPAAEISALLKDCDPSVLFLEDRYAASMNMVTGFSPDCAVVCIGEPVPGLDSYTNLLKEARNVIFPLTQLLADDPACMIYTSGTTGRPKGAVLTHRGVVLNCRESCHEAIRFKRDDVTLMVMPLFHVGGVWYYLFPSFASGCLTLIRERFDLEDVVATSLQDAVTVIHVVPTMLAEMLAHPDFISAAAHLRLIVYAGSSMPLDLLQRAMDQLSGCGFAQAYGSTEGGIICALDPASHHAALSSTQAAQILRSCGKPLSDTQVIIERADQGSKDPIGEILVKSSRIMGAYWQLPDATSERIDQGWLKTGDLGYFDADGYLYIVDRKNDMVISGGENIYPFEVEEVLRTHPDVLEVSVFGLPDPKWVERLVAAVVRVPESGISEQALIEHVRQHLPGYKTPKTIFFTDALPKSPVGKVLRKILRETFLEPKVVEEVQGAVH